MNADTTLRSDKLLGKRKCSADMKYGFDAY